MRAAVSIAALPACLLSLCLLAACGDDPADAGSGDQSDGGDASTGDAADVAESDKIDDGDVDENDATGDAADVSDAADTHVPDHRPRTFRAIGGMSMGAAAITIALEHPGTFDTVGALGGYPDFSYMMAQMLRMHFSGFCPLAELEARPDALDDPNAEPPVTCGPVTGISPLEPPQDFDHLHYDDNGITMTRGFYADVIDNFSCAYGNLATTQHADSPLFPAGLDLDWYRATPAAERCATPKPIPAALAYNAEYNPLGAHPVIPLCDIDEPVTPGLSPSTFDVAAPRDRPVQALLAVDINGNGKRDLGEPLFLNPWERFADVGADGCGNALEDGLGGCVADPPPSAPAIVPPLPADPNGDDFDWQTNVDGTERNDKYDLGEPFSDLGLDGVSADVTGAPDRGEGNGVWDAVPAFATLMQHDADTLLRQLDAAALDRMDFWFDAGIRDALNAGVVARGLVAALRSRGREVTVYHGFAGSPGTLVPGHDLNGLVPDIFDVDLSAAAIGRDVYLEYGNPDATPAQIAEGDGKHVGTPSDALNRLAAFIAMAFRRMPDPDLAEAPFPDDAAHPTSFYSPAMGGRRNYTIALPPGYDLPENAARRYPVVFFLHGLGQDANDLAPAALATAALMSQGRVPKSLFVFPDGACCFLDHETNQRECACGDEKDGVRQCVDPSCTGPEDTCEVRAIPDSRLERECQKGSLYADMQADKWGRPHADMGYGTSVYELVQHVDQTYRTRLPTTGE